MRSRFAYHSGMSSPVKTFDARIGAVREISGETAARLIEATADIALVLDEGGTIRDVYLAPDSILEESRDWLGRPWIETVTSETRPKVQAMLETARTGGGSRRRQVNHAFPSGLEVPVMYSAVRLDAQGRTVAIGRDLRAVSAMQQRLVEVQQAMERDYWRMRHVETRYRLLFQLTSEAVLVVDATSGKILDANPPAGRIFGSTPKRLMGRVFASSLEAASRIEVEQHLSLVRSRGDAEPVVVRAGESGPQWLLSAALVRHDASPLFLVRLLPVEEAQQQGDRAQRARLLDVLHRAPDGFVLADFDGRIIAANLAFLDLTEMASEEQVRGEPLSHWLGRPGADLPVLLSSVREHGVVRLFATTVHGEYGASAEVEISAVAVSGATPCVGLTLRDVGRRLLAGPRGAEDLTRAVEQLTGLVGRVSLKELVRDTIDLVERHFIEAALELTAGNRTSAAEVLGVSRQSLYVKLRRHGDLGERDDAGPGTG
jgi:transcriptional regulator PpsR